MANHNSQIEQIKAYCNSLTKYKRFKTREVQIGSIGLGGTNPIRIQSMTTTDTMDILATVEQSIRMIEAGCELIRITAPSKKEAENLQNIKDELRKKGYATPLVADIHFTPNAAEIAAQIVEKVRINPGNYADKKKFEVIEYTDATYQAELQRIRERFTPLVELCKQHGTAMRIGTNHGSLSDRILSRYGDTPLGMVESAMEFLRICQDLNYHNIVLSMKASNTQVMVQAYRLLVQHMLQEGMNYPLHLGVTEAGEGEDGRIKSAVGIGTLLEDGLGDTIRVSLTEDPEFEAPVALALANRYTNREQHAEIPEATCVNELADSEYNPFLYSRRHTNEIRNLGGTNVPRVIADYSSKTEITAASLFAVGLNYSVPTDKWNLTDLAADYIFVGNHAIDFEIPGTLGIIQNAEHFDNKPQHFPYFTLNAFKHATNKSSELNFVEVGIESIQEEQFTEAAKNPTVVFVLKTSNTHAMPELRRIVFELLHQKLSTPVVPYFTYISSNADEVQLHSATDFGGLFIDGFGDGIFLSAPNIPQKIANQTAFGILQASRVRTSKTEYISCPSCGRTLFDLQETTAKIRKRTDHLKGIKIGIMGCIVNGPGEMADADYGYVGTGVGKISLYKGQEVVKRNIASEQAVDELIELIRTHGDWVDPILD